MVMSVGEKYVKRRAKCRECGRMTNVKLYHNYKTGERKYFCEKCQDFLDSKWEDAELWDNLDSE